MVLNEGINQQEAKNSKLMTKAEGSETGLKEQYGLASEQAMLYE